NEPRFEGVAVSWKVEFGGPYSHISAQIAEKQVDLVVMGSKGVTGLKEVFVGSNTEKVVRHAKCPVITIKKPVNVSSIKEIAFAASLRKDEGAVIDAMKKLQEIFDARLNIVMVNTPNNFMSDRDIKKQMRRLIEKHGLENYTLNIYNEVVEEDGIVFFAEEIGADLIALGTHGRKGLMHFFGGSITEDVVNHANRPVWSFNIHQPKKVAVPQVE
ncbi:universal stress protein, partial [Xanthovirga aplysinae]|uniref:universal stress protein n=1 Tax=Xanthovirga aplysinae TaxID=2529853 RepID=UPI0012BC702B